MRGSSRGPAPKDNVGGKVENSSSGRGGKAWRSMLMQGVRKDW